MTATTSVSSSSASARSWRASSEAVRSLSTTASTPRTDPASSTTGIPPPPGADHDGPGAEQEPDSGQVEQFGGLGGGHHAAPAGAVLAHLPAVGRGQGAGLRLVVHRPDELGRAREGRVVPADPGPADQAGHLAPG